jgi:hypothetical protein
MLDRLLNPYKKGILVKLKSKYKGIWRDIYNIFELYQFLIQLDEYMVIALESDDEMSLEDKYTTFFREFKKHYELPDEVESKAFLKKFLNIIDRALSDSSIEGKALLLRLGRNEKFKRALEMIEVAIKAIFDLNGIFYIETKRSSSDGFRYSEFKLTTQKLNVDANEMIKQQIEVNNKLKEYKELQIEKYINENDLKSEIQIIDDEKYYVLLTKNDTIDSVYTKDNIKHNSLELAIEHNKHKKEINDNYNEISLSENKLVFKGKIVGVLEKVDNLTEKVKEYNSKLNKENLAKREYEEKEFNEPTIVSLTENDLTRQVAVVKILDNRGIERPVIIEGKFKGVFLDQIVSNVGRMLDTEFYTLNTENLIVEKIKNDSSDSILKEPFLTLKESKLILNLPITATKESAMLSKVAKQIGLREFELTPDSYIDIRTKLGSVMLSGSAKDFLFKYYQIEEKNRILKEVDAYKDYSISKIEGFKKDSVELNSTEKEVLSWIESNPKGIIGLEISIEKLLLALALKNPNNKYILISKEMGNLNKEISKSLSVFPTNIRELTIDKAKINSDNYSKVFFNNVLSDINHPNKYYFTSTLITHQIDDMYRIYNSLDNQKISEEEINEWCSIYSNRISNSFVGIKKEKKSEFLGWLRTHTLMCLNKTYSLDSSLGIEKKEEPEIIISQMSEPIEQAYTSLSKEITNLLKEGKLNKNLIATKISSLNDLLNNPKKVIPSFNGTNPKIDKSIELGTKFIGKGNKIIYFTEDEDLAQDNALSLSKKTTGYHVAFHDNFVFVYKDGSLYKQMEYKEFKINNEIQTITSDHLKLLNIDISNFQIGIHLDRGDFSVDTLDERSKLLGNRKEIYIDVTAKTPTLDAVFGKLSLEQKDDIESVFKDIPKEVKVNSNLEGLIINKDLLESAVSASPVVHNLIQKRIIDGKKAPLINKSVLDHERFTKLEKNNPHLLAKIRNASHVLKIPYEIIADLSCSTTIHNSVTKVSEQDNKVEIIENDDGTKTIRVYQKNDMLGQYDEETPNVVVRDIQIKNGKVLSVHNELLTSSECSPKGIGTKVLFSQYKMALNYGVPKIETLAGGDHTSFDEKGNIKKEALIGYYVWGKLGYDTNILKNKAIGDSQIDNLISSLNTPKWKELKEWLYKYTSFDPNKKTLYLSDVYSCTINGKLVGQQWWKEKGYPLYVELSTDPNSISFRIINNYFKKKCDEEGLTEEEYLLKELPPFNTESLDCWNSILKEENSQGVNNNNISQVVEKYSNDLIKAIIQYTDIYPYPKELKLFLFLLYRTPNSPRKKAIFNSIPSPVLKGVLKKLYEMENKYPSRDEILTRIFKDIETGSIKLASDKQSSNASLLELANDPLLDKQWINMGIELQSKNVKKEMLESDPLLKNKVK